MRKPRKQRNVRKDWFGKVQREFERVVKPFAGQPILYVEVGVWAGNSLQWMLDNILTHDNAVAVGIDPYLPGHNYGQKLADETYEEVRQRFSRQIEARKLKLCRDKSLDVLNWGTHHSAFNLTHNSAYTHEHVDILYLDGCHDAHSVVLDFCYAWPMLKTGSVVIFDDWGIGKRKGDFHVPAAVSAITMAFGRWIETISEGRQYAIKVREMPELGKIQR